MNTELTGFDNILFVDLEPFDSSPNKSKVREIGLVISDAALKHSSAKTLASQLQAYTPELVCGHNYRKFDHQYLNNTALWPIVERLTIIDTLELSLLFFSEETHHKLPKAYKDKDPRLINDPLEDARLTRTLLQNIIEKFSSLNHNQQHIYRDLFRRSENLRPFLKLIPLHENADKLKPEILAAQLNDAIGHKIKNTNLLAEAIVTRSEEVAYIFSVLSDCVEEIKAFPLKVLKDYPRIQQLFNNLVFNVEEELNNLSISAEKYFGFPTFRSFPKFRDPEDLFAEDEEVSQREIVCAALNNKDLLTVLPTGGGKTFTFWLPAIIKAKKTRSLTVVISPLQALMKDHIFNFNQKLAGLSTARALSGYLSMPEQRSIVKEVLSGRVDILYLAPESLRSKRQERLLLSRYIDRVVIDEAHCLATWGNDFRHDYFYIAQFIKKIQDDKYENHRIPISCFTATANKKTIAEIENYFEEHLSVRFDKYIASPSRTNLSYTAKQLPNKNEKTQSLVSLLREIKDPSLVYNPASRRQCEMIAEQLSTDLGRPFYAFHAGMGSADKHKILTDYIDNKVDGIVATTAFGMGIDKPDIRHVIHYEISSSLEDYMQESGRAGRDGSESHCHVLYNSEDFDKLFFSLIRQKVTQPEIRKIFQAIKRYRGTSVKNERRIIVSVNELARSAGIKTDDENTDFDTKVKTAILELERAGYVRRGYNKPDIFVTALHFSSMEDLHKLLVRSGLSEDSADLSIRSLYRSIILLSQILIKRSTARFSIGIEELADLLSLEIDAIYEVLNKMRDLGLVSLKEDLILADIKVNKLRTLVEQFPQLRISLPTTLRTLAPQRFRLKDLNQKLNQEGASIQGVDYALLLRILLLNLTKKGQFECYKNKASDNTWRINIVDINWLEKEINKLIDALVVVIRCVEAAHKKSVAEKKDGPVIKYEEMVNYGNKKLGRKLTVSTYDKCMLILHNLRLLRLEGGRVLHHSKVELYLDDQLNNRKQYTIADYKERMAVMYERKRAAIHVMNVYVELLEANAKKANELAIDYFTLDHGTFVSKYELKQRLKLPVSSQRYQDITENLTDEQKRIVFNKDDMAMLVLAGPGTGKTKVLVNKMAHMIIDEDYKPEHFLMLTFTRSAVHEFKQRLFSMLGDLAYDIAIYTFHGYATELLGVSPDKDSEDSFIRIIDKACCKLSEDDVDLPFKNVIILDEYQDINDQTFQLVHKLHAQYAQMKSADRSNEVRIIAVGDDDQCIMELANGASVDFMRRFETTFCERDEGNADASWYRLSTNFRSSREIVECSNLFASQIRDRMDLSKIIQPASNKLPGEVIINYYNTSNFLQELKPLIECSAAESVAILAHENDQVLQLYSALSESKDLKVSYLLQNDGLYLYQLDEIQFFTQYLQDNLGEEDQIIDSPLFDRAKSVLAKTYADSSQLSNTFRYIYEFEEKHDLLTISFWINYIHEVLTGSLDSSSQCAVSTIHRAKGKEFDEVHVVLQDLHNQKNLDYFYRLYYVALTRAKATLHIHSYPQEPFRVLEKSANEVIPHTIQQVSQTKRRLFVMGIKDVYLSFLAKNKKSLKFVDEHPILSGSLVSLNRIREKYNIILDGKVIAQTSKAFSKKLIEMEELGFGFQDCEIEFVAHWYCSDTERHYKQFLCKVWLIKDDLKAPNRHQQMSKFSY